MKVLITEPIYDEGIDILSSYAQVDVKLELTPEEILSIIGDYDALVVRSQTQVSAKVIGAAKKLQVIARAGIGVDNIDIEEATRHGIVVVNAPTGNTISAAEHAIALMLSLNSIRIWRPPIPLMSIAPRETKCSSRCWTWAGQAALEQ
ncbi:unnamed protein product [marine sediment metagenome]|uniref:D-isomer specific 2-hydroxyacid dehydrogenase catalytic domain-containing protein n=1 Tax=marine sediment metagenome TaxID=412755 RepID=X1TN23_9ZZZZ